MESIPRYYSIVFNAATDALAALENQNFGLARELLIRGQQQAEEAFLESCRPTAKTP